MSQITTLIDYSEKTIQLERGMGVSCEDNLSVKSNVTSDSAGCLSITHPTDEGLHITQFDTKFVVSA